jgi:hypothetical protein
LGKVFKEEGEMGIREGRGGVINDGSSMRLRTKGIIVGLLVVEETKLRVVEKESIDLLK